MKILILLFVLFAAPAYGAISEVALQKATGSSAASVASLGIAFPNNVAAGNLICVGGSMYTGSNGDTVTITDSRSTDYTATYLYNDDGSPFYTYLACGKALTSGANTITITPSVNAYIDAAIDEFTGQDLGTFIDVDGGGDTNIISTAQPSLSITATTNALILAVMAQGASGSNSIAEAGGWTLVGEQEDNSCCSSFSFIFQVASGAQVASWTLPVSDYSWLTYAISVKPASAPAAVVHHRAIIIQ